MHTVRGSTGQWPEELLRQLVRIASRALTRVEQPLHRQAARSHVYQLIDRGIPTGRCIQGIGEMVRSVELPGRTINELADRGRVEQRVELLGDEGEAHLLVREVHRILRIGQTQ